jgi:hypothetical protein
MNTLFLPLLFLLLAVLLLWIIIGCRGHITAKIWTINVTIFFVAILWVGIESYTGWPTSSPMPAQARLIHVISDEPDSIYVLLENHADCVLYYEDWHDFIYYKPKDAVRLFKIPYDKNMHKQLEAAMEEVKKGRYVILSRHKVYKFEENRLDDRDKDGDGSLTKNADFRFYVLPPSKFINKPTN